MYKIMDCSSSGWVGRATTDFTRGEELEMQLLVRLLLLCNLLSSRLPCSSCLLNTTVAEGTLESCLSSSSSF